MFNNQCGNSIHSTPQVSQIPLIICLREAVGASRCYIDSPVPSFQNYIPLAKLQGWKRRNFEGPQIPVTVKHGTQIHTRA